MDLFTVTRPSQTRVPIVVSVPHSGTEIPTEYLDRYDPAALAHKDDTDWYVDRLYDFSSELGITMIKANYSRWWIDLNRNPESKPLYNDGRIVTGLCPTTTFAGEKIYLEGQEPKINDIAHRLENYYWPYYRQIQLILDEITQDYDQVLLWDAHSIRQYVPLISKEVFPDLILGDNDYKSASSTLIDIALNSLGTKLSVNHNDPFKGGHITRYFGKPEMQQHALQLEMSKINYMNNSETAYHPERANVMRDLLSNTFVSLIKQML